MKLLPTKPQPPVTRRRMGGGSSSRVGRRHGFLARAQGAGSSSSAGRWNAVRWRLFSGRNGSGGTQIDAEGPERRGTHHFSEQQARGECFRKHQRVPRNSGAAPSKRAPRRPSSGRLFGNPTPARGPGPARMTQGAHSRRSAIGLHCALRRPLCSLCVSFSVCICVLVPLRSSAFFRVSSTQQARGECGISVRAPRAF
jgi:hypothetical protein